MSTCTAMTINESTAYIDRSYDSVLESADSGCVNITVENVTIVGRANIETLVFSGGINSITISQQAFEGCVNLNALVFHPGIENITIDSGAFEGCENLDTLVFHPGVENITIDDRAFINCNIETFVLPAGVESITIAENAFLNCSIETLVLPGRCTNVDMAFLNSLNFKTLVFPAGAENITIGRGVFARSRNLESLVFHPGVENITIGEDAFRGCNIESLVFPVGVESITIGKSAFIGCRNLESLVFPAGVKNITIGEWAFKGCNIESLVFPEGVESITIRGGAFARCRNLASLVFHPGVENITIGEDAFRGCNIESLVFPVGVESITIGKSAFIGCRNLESLVFPAGVKNITIGEEAFKGCNIETFILPADVESITIAENALRRFNSSLNCSIETLVLPGRFTNVDMAFLNSLNFKTLVFHPGVENVTIGEEAFRRCNIESLVFPVDVESITIGEGAFRECNIESLVFPRGVESITIGKSAFRAGCRNLESLVFPAGVKNITIGEEAFKGCNIESLFFPEGVESITISRGAFARCRNLASLAFPEGVKNITIGEAAFHGCRNLEFLFFPVDVESIIIDDGAFAWSSNLESLFFSAGIKNITIGEWAFRVGCDNLESLVFPAGAENITICEAAFKGCNIESLVFPEGVESITIRREAFEGCENLKTLVFPAGIENITIDSGAFEGCNNLESIVLSKDVDTRNIYSKAFEDCPGQVKYLIEMTPQQIEPREAFNQLNAQSENGLIQCRYLARCKSEENIELYFGRIYQFLKDDIITFDEVANSIGKALYTESGATLGHSLAMHSGVQYLELYLKFLKKLYNYNDRSYRKKVVKLLNLEDSSGETLLDIALKDGDGFKSDILRRHGAKSGRWHARFWVSMKYNDPEVLDFDKPDPASDTASDPASNNSQPILPRRIINSHEEENRWFHEPYWLDNEDMDQAMQEREVIIKDDILKAYYDEALRTMCSMFLIFRLVDRGVIGRRDALGEHHFPPDKKHIDIDESFVHYLVHALHHGGHKLSELLGENFSQFVDAIPFAAFIISAISTGIIEPKRNKKFAQFWQQAIFYTLPSVKKDEQLAESVARKLTIYMRNDLRVGINDKPEELDRWNLFCASWEAWEKDDKFKEIPKSQLNKPNTGAEKDAEHDVAGMFFLIFSQEETRESSSGLSEIAMRDKMVDFALAARGTNKVCVDNAGELPEHEYLCKKNFSGEGLEEKLDGEGGLEDEGSVNHGGIFAELDEDGDEDGYDEMKMGDDGELTSDPSSLLSYHT